MNKFEKFEEKNKIRYEFNEKEIEVYFSVVDVIEKLSLSKDPRNYWKVLKNRLKSKHNELVTGCNSIKMPSRDGKSYLTDVANSNVLLKIINLISPSNVKSFGEYFDYINQKNRDENDLQHATDNNLSTFSIDEGEISIDMYKDKDYLIVEAMIAGVTPGNIFVSVNYNKIIIKGDRLKNDEAKENDYFIQELFWGKFYKEINLPHEIDIDQIEASFNHGLLVIKCPILDKERVKIIKLKNI